MLTRRLAEEGSRVYVRAKGEADQRMNKFVDQLDRKRKEGGKKKYNTQPVLHIPEKKTVLQSQSHGTNTKPPELDCKPILMYQ